MAIVFKGEYELYELETALENNKNYLQIIDEACGQSTE
jgi:hypothetical protein